MVSRFHTFLDDVLKPQIRSVVAGKAGQRVAKVAHSQAFRTLVSGPIMENIAECAGEMIGSSLARGVALIPTSVRLGMGAAAVAGAYLYAQHGTPEDVNHAVAIGTAAAGASIMPSMGLQLAGAVVGGFAGVKVMGSEEKLYNPEEPLKSYAFKSLTAKAANEVVGGVISNSRVLIDFVQEQVVGCLAFNALDIKETVQKIEGGRALDDVLPEKLEVQTSGCFETWADSLTHLFSEEIHIRFENVNHLSLALKEELIAQSVNLLKDKVLINADKYIQFMNRQPELKGLLQEIHAELSKSDKDEAKLKKMIDQYDNKLLEIHPQLKEVQKFLSKMIAELGSSLMINQVSSDIRVQALLHYLTSANIKLEESDLRDIAKLGLDHIIDITSNHCAEWIKDQEEKMIGFNLTSDEEKEVLSTTLKLHLAPILLLAFNDVITLKQEELDVREAYTHLNTLFWSYYQPKLGNTVTTIFEGVVANQIRNSSLRH